MVNKVVFIEPLGTIIPEKSLKEASATLGYITATVSEPANYALSYLHAHDRFDVVLLSPWETNSYPIGVIMGSLFQPNRIVANLHVRDNLPESRVLNWLVANPDYSRVLIITPDSTRFPKFTTLGLDQVLITNSNEGLVRIDERFFKG